MIWLTEKKIHEKDCQQTPKRKGEDKKNITFVQLVWRLQEAGERQTTILCKPARRASQSSGEGGKRDVGKERIRDVDEQEDSGESGAKACDFKKQRTDAKCARLFTWRNRRCQQRQTEIILVRLEKKWM